jgi:MFS transporter, PPP family, 3-phenylpropionic acid transporter
MTAAPSPWRVAITLRLMYALFYGAVAVYVLFFAPYLKGLGFTGEQISLVTLASPFIGIVANLAWASLADRKRAASSALRWCTAAALLPLLALPLARTPLQVAVLLVLHNLAAPACVPLIDSVAFEVLRASGTGSYARTRLFGTVGAMVAVQTLALLLTARGDRAGDVAMPIALVALVAGLALVAQLLPDAPPADRPPTAHDLRALARDRTLRLFMVVCVLHWLAGTPYELLFGVYLRDLGLSSSAMGVALICGNVAEIAMMYALPWLERRWSVRPLLAAAFLATALRWALLATAQTALAVSLLQVLHGLVLGLFWGTVVRAIGDLVPQRLRVTGHALFGSVVVGGGSTLGFWLAGLGYDRLGGAGPLFTIASGLELVPLVLVLAVGARFAAGAAVGRPSNEAGASLITPPQEVAS